MRPTFAFADTLPEPIPIVREVPQYCSCVAGLREYIPSTPHVDARWFQTFGYRTTPAVGRVAMFNYGPGDERQHVAYISKIEDTGFWVKDWNWKPCQKLTHFIKWDDPAIVGFLDLNGSTPM